MAVVPRDGALSSSAAGRPAALVAMMTPGLRLFAMSNDGDLEPLDSVESQFGRPLFHPSGRFLYVSRTSSGSGAPRTLTVYSIDSEGHLALVQTVEGGGGTMAVTLAAVGGAPRL